MENLPEWVKEVRVLRPEPTDVLVLTVGSNSEEVQQMAAEWLEALFPRQKTLVLGPDEDLSVVRERQSPAISN